MGTGSIGGYFGGRLARAGEDVVFIARGAQLQAILVCAKAYDTDTGAQSIRTMISEQGIKND